MDRRQFCTELLGTGTALAIASNALAAPPIPIGSAKKVQWNTSLKSAHKIAIEQDKPLLIVFGASWCTYCHKLERETLSEKHIVAMIERDFVPVHLDFDKDSKVAKILEVERLPCTVILSPQADLLEKHEGYSKSPEFQRLMQGALDKRADIQQVKGPDSVR